MGYLRLVYQYDFINIWLLENNGKNNGDRQGTFVFEADDKKEWQNE